MVAWIQLEQKRGREAGFEFPTQAGEESCDPQPALGLFGRLSSATICWTGAPRQWAPLRSGRLPPPWHAGRRCQGCKVSRHRSGSLTVVIGGDSHTDYRGSLVHAKTPGFDHGVI